MAPSADVMIRDSVADLGAEPSGSPFWESPDIVVRRADDDVFSHQNPIRGQRNFIYVRVRNLGKEVARNIRVEMRAAAFPGTEFVYPYDWTQEDATHIEPFGVDPHEQQMAVGAQAIFKFRLGAPDVDGLYGFEQQGLHPCLLAQVHSNEDVTAPGFFPVHVWDRNNLAQRNISTVGPLSMRSLRLRYAFIAGNPFNREPYMEIAVDRSRLPKNVELYLDPSDDAGFFPALEDELARGRGAVSTRVLDRTRLAVSLGCSEAIFTIEAGSFFEWTNGGRPDAIPVSGAEWVEHRGRRLLAIRDESAVIAVPKNPGERRQMSLTFGAHKGSVVGKHFVVRVSQRNTRGQVVGGLTVRSEEETD